MLCRSLFVLLSFFFRPLCCLYFFDLQILITSLLSSSSSYQHMLLYLKSTFINTQKKNPANHEFIKIYLFYIIMQQQSWQQRYHVLIPTHHRHQRTIHQLIRSCFKSTFINTQKKEENKANHGFLKYPFFLYHNATIVITITVSLINS